MDSGGHPRQPGTAGHAEGAGPGFSKRTGQIDAELDRLAADGRERTPRLVKWAVQATRKPKEHERRTPCMDGGGQRRPSGGVDADTLVRQVTGRTPPRPGPDGVRGGGGRLFDRLAGPDGLTEHASTFTRHDILVALGAGLAGHRRTSWRSWPTGSWPSGRSAWSPTGAGGAPLVHPELLAVEQRLVASRHRPDRRADGRGLPRRRAAALAAHPTAGADQQAMVRDLCQGGAGVAVVVGRAGTGKTFALGMARHAWQLDGYRLLATAPTGIATVSLEGEGFEEVATCDRLPGRPGPRPGAVGQPDGAGGG